MTLAFGLCGRARFGDDWLESGELSLDESEDLFRRVDATFRRDVLGVILTHGSSGTSWGVGAGIGCAGAGSSSVLGPWSSSS